ncbi:MAG: ABC transporter ATP-binding protein/permease [Lachnospiraceae bacterium]|nr:ABC transporter ATP-binding protein/permease [Lachnospiraceae bacterium]
MKEVKIPKKIEKLIRENGEADEEIIASSASDMNVACEYADGYVVLTSKALYVFASESDSKQVHLFKGAIVKKDEDTEDDKEWHVRRFPADDYKKLTIEPQVACSLLVITDNEDVERTLTVFSNLHRKSMFKLSREFAHLPGKEEKGEGPGGPGRGFGGPHGHGRGGDGEGEDYCPKCGRMYPNPERKVCPHCIDRKTIFTRTLKYFGPYKIRIVALIIMYTLVAALNLVWPYLNGTVLYDYVLKKNLEFLPNIGLRNANIMTALLLVIITMFAAKLVQQLLNILQGATTAKIVADVVCDMKKSIFDSMGKLSISFFKNRQTGSLMTRVLNDADRVTSFFIDDVPYIFIHSITLVTTVLVMVRINWQMALASMFLLPISFIFSFKFRPKFWNAFGRRHRAERSVNNQVNDNLTGARVVKAFGQEKKEEHRFSSANTRLKDTEMSIVRLDNIFSAIFQLTHNAAGIIIWCMGAFFILNKGTMALGILVTFIGYTNQLDGPMRFMSRVFRSWSDSMNAAQRMFEIIDAVPEILEDENPVPLDNPKGDIELRNVTFGYEINRPVLKNVSLNIPAGSMLGIVGRSGAGKTTLVNLISRMYDPNEGQILFDGIDIKHISFHDLRRNVAMVSQETYIFMGTIEENIAYANPNAAKAEIIRAAKLASAHDFILRMPDGYNTVVGSSGRQLSGGERQRISIARAILADPKILILDEATASVDTETERAIQASINYLIKGRTTIYIAHRLSTLRDADFLCVIDNGEITERGTHAELEALRGTYYKLMELQTKALALKE